MLRSRIIEGLIVPVVEEYLHYINIFDLIHFNEWIVNGYGDSVITGDLLDSVSIRDGDIYTCEFNGGIFENCLFYDCILDDALLMNCTLIMCSLNNCESTGGCNFEYCFTPGTSKYFHHPTHHAFANEFTWKNIGNNHIVRTDAIGPENFHSDRIRDEIKEIRSKFKSFYDSIIREGPGPSLRTRYNFEQQLLGGDKRWFSRNEVIGRNDKRYCQQEFESISNNEVHSSRYYKLGGIEESDNEWEALY